VEKDSSLQKWAGNRRSQADSGTYNIINEFIHKKLIAIPDTDSYRVGRSIEEKMELSPRLRLCWTVRGEITII
jgi:hypothetical protein